MIAEEVRTRHPEAGVELSGPLLLVGRSLADVLDGQGGGDDHDLVDAAVAIGLEHHSPERRVERQPGEACAERGESAVMRRAVGLERPELLEERHAVGDVATVGRLDERERFDVAQTEGGHLQDDRGEVGAEDLGLGELRAGIEVVLGEQPDAHARRDPAAPTGPLVGRCLRDRLDREPLHLRPLVVAGDASRSGIDDGSDAGHGERRLGDVGRDHDSTSGVAGEDPVLFGCGESGEQRQHLGVAQTEGFDGLGSVADLPLAGLEHQHVARHLPQQATDRLRDGLGLVAVIDGPVAHLDRVGATGDLDDGCVSRVGGEVLGEAFGVDRRRCHDDLEVGATGQELAQVPEDEVDVQTPLVGLVHDDRVVSVQLTIPLQLVEQDAVGHQLEPCVGADLVGEAHRVADHAAEFDTELLGDALGDGPGRDAARLGVADALPTQFEAQLGQLCALARSGLPRHDHHLVVADRGQELIVARRDRELGRIGRQDGFESCGHGSTDQHAEGTVGLRTGYSE